MRDLFNLILDAVFPLVCAGCGKSTRSTDGPAIPLCQRCIARLVPPPTPICGRCGVPLGAATHSEGSCGPCRRNPPAFAVARGAALYDPSAHPVLARTLHAFKFDGVRALAQPLAALVMARLPIAADAVLVPVPLHRRRLRERGFNQAALLAQAIGRATGCRVLLQGLARRAPASQQSRLGRRAREANVAGAFVTPAPSRIAGLHVVIVDDVITTGATADACARALLAAGANRVDVCAVGRTPRPAA